MYQSFGLIQNLWFWHKKRTLWSHLFNKSMSLHTEVTKTACNAETELIPVRGFPEVMATYSVFWSGILESRHADMKVHGVTNGSVQYKQLHRIAPIQKLLNDYMLIYLVILKLTRKITTQTCRRHHLAESKRN